MFLHERNGLNLWMFCCTFGNEPHYRRDTFVVSITSKVVVPIFNLFLYRSDEGRIPLQTVSVPFGLLTF